MSKPLIFTISAAWDDEAAVWTGHCDDIPAAADAPTLDELLAKISAMALDLLADNHPGVDKGRVFPRSYMNAGPFEMYDREELAFQKRHAFATLIRNGVTTALPIASLFYREWAETPQEFADAAQEAASLGLRVYLGPAYRTGNLVVEADGAIATQFDELLMEGDEKR